MTVLKKDFFPIYKTVAAMPAAAHNTGQKLTKGNSIEHPCVGGGTHALVDKPHTVLHSSF